MILLKGFFRKRSTQMYFVIFTVIITAITVLLSFINYYKTTEKDLYIKNSFMLITSEKDYFDNLSSNKNISSIKEVLVFEPNKEDYNVVVDSNYVAYKNGVQSDSKLIDGAENKMNWDDFEVSGSKYIIVMYNDNFELNQNEIALSITHMSEWKIEFAKEMIGEKIGFYYNNQNIEFTIKSIYETTIPSISISRNVYEKIRENREIYSYIIMINDKKNESLVKNELKKISEISIVKHESYNTDDSVFISTMARLLDSLMLANFASILFFIIILIVGIKNIMDDDKKNMNINKKLGYNFAQIKFNVLKQVIVLSGFSLFFSSIMSSFFNIIFNNLFNFGLKALDIKLLGIIYTIVFIMTLFLGITFNTKKIDLK